MPDKPTFMNEALYEYVIDNFGCDDDFLIKLKEEAIINGLPNIFITPELGRFLQFYLKSISAKYILEIGTLAGYSTIVMARALPASGKIYTIEINDRFADFAEKKIYESDVADKVVLIRADARKFLKNTIFDNLFDFAFVDANKPFYKFYLDVITPLLRVGGAFAADNAFAFGHILSTIPEKREDDIKSIKKFNSYFRNNENYFTTMVSIGDGLIIGTKKP